MTTFSVPLAQLAEKLKADVNLVVQKTTVQVFSAVVQKTPVDSGRARANWNISRGAPDATTTESTDQARGQAEANKALGIPAGGVVFLSNGLPYARVLEYGLYPNPPKKGTGKTAGGFSRQAPAGMVRTTAAEFDDYVRRAIGQ